MGLQIVNNQTEIDRQKLLKAISNILESVANLIGNVIRTKQGRLKYFDGQNFNDIDVSAHTDYVKKIASGLGFTLAQGRNKLLLLIVFSLGSYTVHVIDFDVEDIWAHKNQIYFKTINNVLKGVECLSVSHPGATIAEEYEFLEFIVSQVNKTALPSGSK